MVSQPEGSESAPKFSRIIGVFVTTKIRLGGKRVKTHFRAFWGAADAKKSLAALNGLFGFISSL